MEAQLSYCEIALVFKILFSRYSISIDIINSTIMIKGTITNSSGKIA